MTQEQKRITTTNVDLKRVTSTLVLVHQHYWWGFILHPFGSTLCASSQTVINSPVSLTSGVRGQNTCRCKHWWEWGRVWAPSFPLSLCENSRVNAAAFDSSYISVIIELAGAGLLGSILMLSHSPRWARYKEKTRCDNISSIINRVASSLFPTDRLRIDCWWGRELILTAARAHSEVRNFTASGGRKAETCNSGREAGKETERSEEMKRSRRWSPTILLSRSVAAFW